jgi:hypothetical protein
VQNLRSRARCRQLPQDARVKTRRVPSDGTKERNSAATAGARARKAETKAARLHLSNVPGRARAAAAAEGESMSKKFHAIRQLGPDEVVRVSEPFDLTIDVPTAAARAAAETEQERIAAGKSDGSARLIRVGAFARDAIKQRKENE